MGTWRLPLRAPDLIFVGAIMLLVAGGVLVAPMALGGLAALALGAGGFAWLARTRRSELPVWLGTLFFLAISLQNVAGGLLHKVSLPFGYVLGVVLVLGLLVRDGMSRRRLTASGLELLFLVYLLAAAVWAVPTVLDSPAGGVVGWLYAGRFMISYLLFKRFSAQPDHRKALFATVLGIIALNGVVAISQQFFGWEQMLAIQADVREGNWNNYYAFSGLIRRSVGWLLTPLDCGFVLMGAALMVLPRAIQPGQGRSRWLLGLLVLAMLTTVARGAIMGFLFAVVCYVLFFPRVKAWQRALVLMALIAAGSFLLLNAQIASFVQATVSVQDGSAMAHYTDIFAALDIFLKAPWGLGIGRSGFTVQNLGVADGYNAEGYWFQVLIQQGVFGALIWAALMGTVLVQNWRAMRRHEGDRRLFHAGLVLNTLAFMVGGFVLPIWNLSTSAVWFWGLVGGAARLRLADREGGV